MKRCITLLAFICVTVAAHSQAARLASLSAINSRIGQPGNDTVYVLNFWATWCAPCVKELPAFERLNRTASREKIKVILISMDVVPALHTRLNPFLIKKNIQSEVLLLNEKYPQEFINRVDSTWSGALPATLILKNGSRKFFEKELSFTELVHAVHAFN